MENTLKKERDQLIEIKNVFKDEPKQARVISRQQNKSGMKNKGSLRLVQED
jgi:hypothetical protein